MDDKVIKRTQETLGKIIKKPPLSDKLLSKPPFRFLHDIMTSIIKSTGVFKGLYTDHEMVSDNVKEKDNKIAFLQKVIDVLGMVTGEALTVRPSKIVAGQEPEKTNEFLQLLAKTISKKLDCTDAIQRVLNGEKPIAAKKEKDKKPDRKEKKDDKKEKTSDPPKKTDKEEKKTPMKVKTKDVKAPEEHGEKKSSSKERERSRTGKEKETKDKRLDNTQEKEHDKEKDRDKEKSRKRESSKEGDKTKHRDKTTKDSEKDKLREKSSREHKIINEKEPSLNGLDRIKEIDSELHKEDDETILKIKESKSEELPKEEINGHYAMSEQGGHTGSSDYIVATSNSNNDLPKPIQRISTARGNRKKPPEETFEAGGDGPALEDADHKVNGFVTEDAVLPPTTGLTNVRVRSARPSSARPAPPRMKKQPPLPEEPARLGSGRMVTNVIEDKTEEEVEDDNFLVEEQTPALAEEELAPIVVQGEIEDGEHGGLVKKILETKKELEESSIRNATNKVEMDTTLMSDVTRRKERERVSREIEKLQGWIQTLTRSANPLGKVMDYLQEDVDSMQKELEMWRQENRQHITALKKEHSITENLLAPLKQQLLELEQSVQDRQDQISALKSSIIHNDEKIEKMVSSLKA